MVADSGFLSRPRTLRRWRELSPQGASVHWSPPSFSERRAARRRPPRQFVEEPAERQRQPHWPKYVFAALLLLLSGFWWRGPRPRFHRVGAAGLVAGNFQSASTLERLIYPGGASLRSEPRRRTRSSGFERKGQQIRRRTRCDRLVSGLTPATIA